VPHGIIAAAPCCVAQNPKSEGRKPKQIPSAKREKAQPLCVPGRSEDCIIDSLSLFRASSFGFGILAIPGVTGFWPGIPVGFSKRKHRLTPAGFRRTLKPPVSMNKLQFTVLNIVGAICGLLIISDLALGILNSRLNGQVNAMQAQFNQAQQIQNTAQNLVMRLAQASQTEAAVQELLVRHDLKPNLNTNTPAPAKP
jgi:hypothetical protein